MRLPARFLPSVRSVLVGAGIVAVAIGAYAAARETSVFAIRRVEVSGGSPALRAAVERTLAPLAGTSLLALDGARLERALDALPAVVSTRYDRAFPHTLRVEVVPETPVAILHRGPRTAWLVSARGRVMAAVAPGTRPTLPRIWVPAKGLLAAGDFLAPDGGGVAARALGLLGRFPARVATASLVAGELTFRLRSGVSLLFGDPTDLRLKLAIARRALALLPPGATYLDISVPERPVAGANSRLSGRG
ncbi:MAG: cell division protein FtsQ/DivIB [Gaiellaceae bacterium]